MGLGTQNRPGEDRFLEKDSGGGDQPACSLNASVSDALRPLIKSILKPVAPNVRAADCDKCSAIGETCGGRVDPELFAEKLPPALLSAIKSGNQEAQEIFATNTLLELIKKVSLMEFDIEKFSLDNLDADDLEGKLFISEAKKMLFFVSNRKIYAFEYPSGVLRGDKIKLQAYHERLLDKLEGGGNRSLQRFLTDIAGFDKRSAKKEGLPSEAYGYSVAENYSDARSEILMGIFDKFIKHLVENTQGYVIKKEISRTRPLAGRSGTSDSDMQLLAKYTEDLGKNPIIYHKRPEGMTIVYNNDIYYISVPEKDSGGDELLFSKFLGSTKFSKEENMFIHELSIQESRGLMRILMEKGNNSFTQFIRCSEITDARLAKTFKNGANIVFEEPFRNKLERGLGDMASRMKQIFIGSGENKTPVGPVIDDDGTPIDDEPRGVVVGDRDSEDVKG